METYKTTVPIYGAVQYIIEDRSERSSNRPTNLAIQPHRYKRRVGALVTREKDHIKDISRQGILCEDKYCDQSIRESDSVQDQQKKTLTSAQCNSRRDRLYREGGVDRERKKEHLNTKLTQNNSRARPSPTCMDYTPSTWLTT